MIHKGASQKLVVKEISIKKETTSLIRDAIKHTEHSLLGPGREPLPGPAPSI